MKRTLLARLCCPVCKGALDLRETHSQGDVIFDGTLRCGVCPAEYPIHHQMPNLIPNGKLESAKAREVEGWASLRQKAGAYEHPDYVTSFSLPYIGGEVWSTVARHFGVALAELNLRGGEAVLDIGGGQGWAARYLAARGCSAVAIDIDPDELYGLGRAWAIMEHAGVYFEPVLADGENLPFLPDTFDVVLFSAALHHFDRLDRVLRQAYRVLKPGGRLVGVGEPAISIFTRERDAQAKLEEWHAGIVERRPKPFEYWYALRRAGLHSIRLDCTETLGAAPQEIHDWILRVRQHLYEAFRPRNKPFVWLLLSLILLMPPRWAKPLTLQLSGGNLLLRAVKADRRLCEICR